MIEDYFTLINYTALIIFLIIISLYFQKKLKIGYWKND